MNPEYQRDYVWSEEDKVDLIDSIMHHRDIGKFVFVENPFDHSKERGGDSYEVLDGKQRINAIIGFINGEFKAFNSAFVIQPHNPEIKSYAKMQLVPFGERVPYQDSFPFKYIIKFLDTLELGQGNWSRGRDATVFSIPLKLNTNFNSSNSTSRGDSSYIKTTKFAVPICYESVFPDLVRKFVVRGAEFLVVITNDAWFGRPNLPSVLSGGMFQHAQIATFRAIENRIAIARCANTGVSAFIDRYGRMRKATKIFKEDVIIDAIALRTETTFYGRHGNIFSYVMATVTIISVISALIFKHIIQIK